MSGLRPTSASASPALRSRSRADSSGSWISSPSVMIRPMVMRGESEPNGSWNTSCSSCRIGRISAGSGSSGRPR